MDSTLYHKVKQAFRTRFGAEPTVVAGAPGRVNIIGEHTDYNGGWVLPMAIHRYTAVAVAPRSDRTLRVYAADYAEYAEASLDGPAFDAVPGWMKYPLAATQVLQERGRELPGCNVLVQGNVPLARGLSSSASLEMAVIKAYEAVGQFSLSGTEAVQLGRCIENYYIGVQSGVMDQYIVRMGQAGHALLIDCSTLEHEAVPVAFEEAVFVIADTGVRRGLADSQYNARVEECARAVRAMNAVLHRNADTLRAFGIEDLESCRADMDGVVYRRARHVVTENIRVLAARGALEKGSPEALGKLLDESHESLRADYEVTGEALDTLCTLARKSPGCYGARMTGAGFGGCAIALVHRDAMDAFGPALLDAYARATGNQGDWFESAPAAGASLWTEPS